MNMFAHRIYTRYGEEHSINIQLRGASYLFIDLRCNESYEFNEMICTIMTMDVLCKHKPTIDWYLYTKLL